jgi:hypothetical protein
MISILELLFCCAFFTGADYPSKFSMRLVQQCSAFLFLIVHIAYSAKLTSLATLYTQQPPLDNLGDVLKSSSWKFGIMNGSLPFNTFRVSLNSLQLSINDT